MAEGRVTRGFEIEALLAHAEAGGPDAAAAARRAALLAERGMPETALRALTIAARLDPLDPTPKLGLARLHAEAGDLDAARTEATAVLSEAVDKAAQARAAFILGEIARVRGDAKTARESYEATAKIEDSLLASSPGDPTASRWFARARGRLAELDAAAGKAQRARTGAEGALAMLRACAAQIGEPPVLAADIADAETRLAALEIDTNEPASARRRLNEAIGRYEALAVLEAEEPHWRAVLADAWALAAEADFQRNAPAEARTAIDKSLQVRIRLATRDPREAWGLAGAWRVRAALLAALGDMKSAADSLEQARALTLQLCAEAKTQDSPIRFLVHTLLDQADHALRMNDLALARRAADEARDHAEPMARAEGGDPTWMSELGACWNRLGEVAFLSGSAQTLDAYARAVEFRRLAVEARPKDIQFKLALAGALVTLGDAALAQKQFRTARAAFSESAAKRLELAEAAPGDAHAARDLAVALERVGVAAQSEGDRNAARAAWEHELELADRIFDDPRNAEGQRFRAVVEAHLSQLGGVDSGVLRAAALARLDKLAQDGDLTERDAALRRKLWQT